jgi:hypothetical protein
MKGAHGHLIGYNVQLAVDAKHDLIVTKDVIPAANDRGQLSPQALAAQAELGVEKLQVVADKGTTRPINWRHASRLALKRSCPNPTPPADKARKGRTFFPKNASTTMRSATRITVPVGKA